MCRSRARARRGEERGHPCGLWRTALFFFDDDDLADDELLEGHVAAHRRRPERDVAVLGYTSWSPALPISPVMEYATEIGMEVFSYPLLRDGQELGFEYFWTGSTSCKRDLLLERGVFDPSFATRLEDIELGYRLSQRGLTIVFERRLVSYANRPLDYDDVCQRCESVGRALISLTTTHPEHEILRYCRLENRVEGRGGAPDEAPRLWREAETDLEERVERARALERRVPRRPRAERLRRCHPSRNPGLVGCRPPPPRAAQAVRIDVRRLSDQGSGRSARGARGRARECRLRNRCYRPQ